MCGNEAFHRPRVRPAARADEQHRRRIQLQPVDSLTITTLVDNIYDVFMPDQGPASRSGPGSTKSRLPLGTMANGFVPDQLVAEHGFSLLLTLTTDGRTHRLLFDCGVSPDGMVENMRRLEIDPRDVEAVVLSHGHFDHIAGLDGLIRRLGRAAMPVLIHPDFWSRRRVLLPGHEPIEIPTTSRGAVEGAGFQVIEERQPSFLFQEAVLVTGEVDRTTGYEPGFPVQEAWRGDRWEPDPLVLDDQAVIVNVHDRGLVIITGCGHAGVVNTTRYAGADRRGAAVRRDGRLPPQRPRIRADHRPHLRRPRRAPPCDRRPWPLHGMAWPASAGAGLRRAVRPQLRRDPLRLLIDDRRAQANDRSSPEAGDAH